MLTYRKQPLKAPKKAEEAVEVSERAFRKILGDPKKQKSKGTSFRMPCKAHEVLKRLTDTEFFDVCHWTQNL